MTNPLERVVTSFGGSTRNCRWLLNTNGFSGGTSVGGTTRPIYSSFLLGQEAYGVVRLGAKEAEFIVKPLGASGTADPLNQRGTVGKELAHSKFSLIDMETLQGDMAQAEDEYLLAA